MLEAFLQLIQLISMRNSVLTNEITATLRLYCHFEAGFKFIM